MSNPFNFPIRVTTLTVDVRDAGASCLAQELQIQTFRGSLLVPPRGTGTADLAVTLLKSAPDACQQATWPLTYSGQAVRTSSSGGGGGGMSALPGGTATAPSGESWTGGKSGPSAAPGQGGLAFTGLTLWILLAIAAALILSGAALLLAQRRRRRLAAGHGVGNESWAR